MKQLSCHVLDTANGRPAAGIAVKLFTLQSSSGNDSFHLECLAEGVTDQDGRARFGDVSLIAQNYTLRFMVAPYCQEQFGQAFFPFIDVNFTVSDERNHHIPLLLSPFSYSSYRGS
ncbi:hydroxyisourate hydrolase [Vibrio sp. ABG19]|uniref:hydroxyisourate hydrolase n=1 Tax=Vibrio sp. ABG19 TaxID=2817385 RepID=UPI00249DF185|nr:hydroxyisourate hydrolase [Vibrio sp. ABG19]WGY44975.1 hydroxyisourate hydrolase [Vibrio sp. ABG19]